jgi:hypothetical protein
MMRRAAAQLLRRAVLAELGPASPAAPAVGRAIARGNRRASRAVGVHLPAATRRAERHRPAPGRIHLAPAARGGAQRCRQRHCLRHRHDVVFPDRPQQLAGPAPVTLDQRGVIPCPVNCVAVILHSRRLWRVTKPLMCSPGRSTRHLMVPVTVREQILSAVARQGPMLPCAAEGVRLGGRRLAAKVGSKRRAGPLKRLNLPGRHAILLTEAAYHHKTPAATRRRASHRRSTGPSKLCAPGITSWMRPDSVDRHRLGPVRAARPPKNAPRHVTQSPGGPWPVIWSPPRWRRLRQASAQRSLA